MGPNGAGKSTLSQAIMGKPGYDVLGGTVTLDGADLLAMTPWQRAQAGLFLGHAVPDRGGRCRRRRRADRSGAGGRSRPVNGRRRRAGRGGADRPRS